MLRFPFLLYASISPPPIFSDFPFPFHASVSLFRFLLPPLCFDFPSLSMLQFPLPPISSDFPFPFHASISPSPSKLQSPVFPLCSNFPFAIYPLIPPSHIYFPLYSFLCPTTTFFTCVNPLNEGMYCWGSFRLVLVVISSFSICRNTWQA